MATGGQPPAAHAVSEPTADGASKAAKPSGKAVSKFESEKLDPKVFSDPDKQGDTKRPAPASGGAIGRMLMGLLFVLAVIFGVYWLLKNYSRSRMPGMVSSGGAIEVVATTPLAANRSLHLVRVGGEVVLIGATETSITRLGTLDAQQMAFEAGNNGNAEFQQMLQASISGRGTSDQDTLARRLIANLQMMTSR